MEVTPRNLVERIYAIAIILLALVMFSSFVSSITSAMTHLRALREEQRRQQEFVRRYIAENKLSTELSNRVQAFIRQHHRMAKPRVHERDITAFRFMPDPLRFQIRCEVVMPTLVTHPLFSQMRAGDDVGFKRICQNAASHESLLLGEELFNAGALAAKMYFTLSGTMDYHHHLSEGVHSRVEAPTRISEVVLWAKWEHQGRLVATQTAELLAIDSSKFRSIVRRRGTLSTDCADYAREYLQRLRADCGTSEYLSDIWDDSGIVDGIVCRTFGASEEENQNW